jgi:hypothetical protein
LLTSCFQEVVDGSHSVAGFPLFVALREVCRIFRPLSLWTSVSKLLGRDI